MNFRRSTVKENHPQTFEWVFKDRLPKYDYQMEFDDTESESDAASTVTTLSGSPSNSSRVDEDGMLGRFSYDTSPPWDSFVEWLRTDDKTYWVSGKPGSGKSTLMLFLLRDDRTRRYLNEWSPDTLVLSHFLLSSGHSLQRNTRGTYCSLLHHMLVDDSERGGVLLSLLASRFPRILSKDVPDDWAQWELKDVTLAALEHSKRPICVFIDGLDELVASEIDDGHLWSLLRSLERIPKLKLCLSSRPEPSFRDYFEGAPKLQMQLLTDGDIRRYATEFLKSSISLKKCQAQQHEVSDFIDIISGRANGVFLWVYLVLKRLRRGMTNKDTMAMLNRRLEGTPKELHGLFQDMWGRLGEDDEISEYILLAARYFHLVDAAKQYSVEYPGVGPPRVIIAYLMMATNRGILRDILEGNEEQVTAKRFQTACGAVVRNLDTCCAGLLECPNITTRLSHSSPDYEDNEQLNYHTLEVDFVHRSARDFLFTTQEGAKILSHDTSTLEDRLVLICQARMTVATLCLSDDSEQLWSTIEENLLVLSEGQTRLGVVLSQRRIQQLVSLGGFLYRHPRLLDIILSPHGPPFESHEVDFIVDFMVELSMTSLVGQVPHYLEMLERGTSSDYAGSLIISICHLFRRLLWGIDQNTVLQEAQLATIQYLVNNGANINFEGLALDVSGGDLRVLSPSHVQLHSAAITLINMFCKYFARLQYHWKLAIVDLMSRIVDQGANLARPIVAKMLRPPSGSRERKFWSLNISVSTNTREDEGYLFIATTPGYILRLALARAILERHHASSDRPSDLETAVCDLLNHEAVSTAPPILEALGIQSRIRHSPIIQANTSSLSERTSVLLRNILRGIMTDAMSLDPDYCWNEIKDMISESGDAVSRDEFDEELVRRKFFVSAEDYMKRMPRLEAEQEALLMERVRNEALEGLAELDRTEL